MNSIYTEKCWSFLGNVPKYRNWHNCTIVIMCQLNCWWKKMSPLQICTEFAPFNFVQMNHCMESINFIECTWEKLYFIVSLHIPFMHAFSALRCVFQVLTYWFIYVSGNENYYFEKRMLPRLYAIWLAKLAHIW